VQYEELRCYYATELQEKIEDIRLERSKIHVLEALLHLRQTAFHPGFVDATQINGGSSKLSALKEQILEVLGGGHKALVFSQFTSFLAWSPRNLMP